jgi:cell division protein FtsQ
MASSARRTYGQTRGPTFTTARRRAIRGEIVLDEAAARRLRRIRLRRALVAAAGVAFIALLVAAYMSPLLRVHNVEVTGASHVDSARVRELASLDGDSMLRLDLAGAERQIAYLPLVSEVRIERHWPHTVRIVVTERQPWGYWQAGSVRYVIDAEGVVLADDPPAEGAPVIADANPVRLVAGDRVDLDAVRLARTLVERVPPMLALNIASFEYSVAQGLALTTDAGYRVVVGDSQNVDYKLAVWKAMEEELGRDSMVGHVLDLRFSDRPSFQ